jgi:hypothetical protein
MIKSESSDNFLPFVELPSAAAARQAARRAADARLDMARVVGQIGDWNWTLDTQHVIGDAFAAQLLSMASEVALDGLTL